MYFLSRFQFVLVGMLFLNLINQGYPFQKGMDDRIKSNLEETHLSQIFQGDVDLEKFLEALESSPLPKDLTLHFGEGIAVEEPSPGLLSKAFRELDSGMLITDGTLSGLMNASLGNFNQVVLANNDRITSLFNVLHLDLIKTIASLTPNVLYQRYLYLAALHENWLTQDELEKIEHHRKDYIKVYRKGIGEPSPSELNRFDRSQISAFIQSLSKHELKETLPESISKILLKMKKIDLILLKSRYTLLEKHGHLRPQIGFKDWIKIQTAKSFLNGFNLSLIYEIGKRMGHSNYYFESDEPWSKILKLLHEERIHVLPGSLTEKTTFSFVEALLKHSTQKLSAVTFSRFETRFSPEQRNQILKHIRSLPKTIDARLFYTETNSHIYHQDPVDSDFVSIYRSEILDPASPLPLQEDPSGEDSGRYIVPNEISPGLYSQVLDSAKEGGTLISVGTFRTLIDASLGHFDRVIFLDFDKRTTEFNRHHLELIQKISDLELSSFQQRLQYLSALHGHWLSDKELQTLEDERDEFITVSKRMDYFSSRLLRDEDLKIVYDFLNELRDKAKDFSHAPQSFKNLIREITKEVPQQGLGFDRFKGGERAEPISYYFEDDEAWLKVTRLIRSHRTQAIVGNVMGDQAIASIAQALRANQEKVSVIDYSNIRQYFEKNPELIEKLEKNITLLPKHSNSYLLETRTYDLDYKKGTQPKNRDIKWDYLHSLIQTKEEAEPQAQSKKRVLLDRSAPKRERDLESSP